MSSFDASRALDQIEGDREGLSILFCTFQRVSAEQLDELRAAIHARNSETAASVAHCLKGSLGVFAAGPAVRIAQQIEASARQSDFDGAQQALVSLEDECTRLKEELAKFLKGNE